MSVCVSVKSHLTSGASVCAENTVTYSTGNKGPKFVGFSLKLFHCRDQVLPPLNAISVVGHFPADSVHAHICTWCRRGVSHFSAFISIFLAPSFPTLFVLHAIQALWCAQAVCL